MKNKKGFTLVELLAVIVILALIMSIAVVSISGVLNSSRYSTFKETGTSILNAVKQQLIINNQVQDGVYYFQESILEKGGKDSPLGGSIQYIGAPSSGKVNVGTASNVTVTQVGTGVYRATTGTNVGSCKMASMSFVRVTGTTYKLCLTAGSGEYYINEATEAQLLGNDTTFIRNTD